MSTLTYSKSGAKASTQVKLNPSLFGVKDINTRLLAQVYVAYLANGRTNLAKTKTRGLISGGGRKPHPQKGTGRARSGSSRNPLWRGGGTVFGPTGLENYSHKTNVKSKRVAVIHALSALNARNGNTIKIIEELSIKTSKTKELKSLLTKLDAMDGYTLIVCDNLSDNLKLASRNLSNVNVCAATYLNVAKLLDSDTLVITKSALQKITFWLMPKSAKEPLKAEAIS